MTRARTAKLGLVFSIVLIVMFFLVVSTASSSTHSTASKASKTIKMKFVGDVMFAGSVQRILKKNGFAYPYQFVGDALRDADLTAINLETSITNRGRAEPKEYAFRSDPANVPHLVRAGVDVASLANNHSMDYGTIGLLDTMHYLSKNGIGFVGAGRDRKSAFASVVRQVKGIRVAFVGFSRVVPNNQWKAGVSKPGTADTYDAKDAVASIQAAQKRADIVVVLAHWGVERSDRPASYQKSLARKYIDAGADLVIGSHPHVLQGFEPYRGKWIAYSLGNFIFTTNARPKTWESGILTATCSRAGQCQLQFSPVLTKYAQPKFMEGEQARALLQRLSQISLHATVDRHGVVRANKK